MSTKIFTFLLFVVPLTGVTQDFVLSQKAELVINNKSLKFPWAGGLNSVNAGMVDVDLDGLEDLIVYEKLVKESLVFRATDEGEFDFAPELSAKLPEITSWFLVKDYNGDGKKDIFTRDPLGIRLFINNLPEGFNLYPVAPLLSEGVAGNINIYLSDQDLPAIEDVDNDGDLDIIAMQYAGTSLEFHKNFQVENGLANDTLVFSEETNEWGNIRICGCQMVIKSEEECPVNQRTEHLSGHSILLLDLDDDQDMDLAYSDNHCYGLNFLVNEGDPQNANFGTTHASVLTGAVSFSYPVPSYDDFDHDGEKDLLVSPGNVGTYNYSMDFEESVWLYKKQGSGIPKFDLHKTNFLQDEMLDAGQNVYPEFYDMDNDGDEDLFLGTLVDHQQNFNTGLRYYENVGYFRNPVFNLVTEDAFGLMMNQKYNLKPQFADLDGDRKPELVLMSTGLATGVTSLSYFKNTGRVKFNSDFSESILLQGITFGANYTVDDVDENGFTDILITTPQAVLRYEFVKGQLFLRDNEYMDLPVNINDIKTADMDMDGRKDMLYSRTGSIYIIYDFISNNEPTPVHLKFSGDGENRFAGQLVTLETANLWGKNIPGLITGSISGGIRMYESADAVEVPVNEPLVLFPNPQSKNEHLNFQSARNMLVQVYSTSGKVILDDEFIPANELFSLPLYNLAPGVYIMNAYMDESTLIQKKFVVIH